MLPGLFYYYGGWDDKDNIIGHDAMRSQLCFGTLTGQRGNHYQAGGGNQIC